MLNIILIIIGFIFLIKGADYLIEGATNIAHKLKISEFVIGLTIVAVGTSLPEMIISISSVIKNHNQLLIGNIIGSCLYNILLILGITLLIQPIKVEKKQNSNILMLIVSSILVGTFGSFNSRITRIEGVLLLLVFMIFLLSIFFENKVDESHDEKNKSLLKIILNIIIGTILLKYRRRLCC